MIVVDTSALTAIALREPTGPACLARLQIEDRLLISAGTLTELLIVASRKTVSAAVRHVITTFDFEVVPVTAAFAEHTATAYRQWGKGFHPAALNFGDCFAYALAKEQDCPLLYVGDDFARTDIASAL